MPNILFLSYDGLTDPLGQSQILPYLTGLSNHGFKITIVTFEKEKNFVKNQIGVKTQCAKAGLSWIPLKYTKYPPVISTIYDYQRMLRKARLLHQQSAFEIVHCRSYIASLTGLVLKRTEKLKFIFDMRGFWADERVDGKLWNLKNPIYKLIYSFFKKKEIAFLSEADSIISLSESAKREIRARGINNLHDSKVEVIPCATDFHHFKLVNADSRRKARTILNIHENDYILSYIGSTGTWYLLDKMLMFFKQLRTKAPNAKFLIFTHDDPKQIMDLARKQNINTDRILVKTASRSELPLLAAASDANIFFIRPSYSKIASSPTKLGEVLAMGIPVVCNSGVGDVEQIMHNLSAGICLKGLEQEDFENAISTILSNDFNPAKIRADALQIFDLGQGVSSYLKVYRNLSSAIPLQSFITPRNNEVYDTF